MPEDEQERDDAYRREAMRLIRSDPVRYLRLSWNRLGYMLWFDPTHPLAANMIYRISYVLLLLVAAPGVFLAVRRKELDPVLALTFGGFLLLHVPILVLPRYRIVPVAILLLLAAYALARWLPSGNGRTAVVSRS